MTLEHIATKKPYTEFYTAGSFGDYDLHAVWPIIEEFKPDIIGYETWRMWSSKKDVRSWSDFPEIQIIGAIKLSTRRLLGFDAISQNPGERVWATDTKLKDRGLFWPIIHQRDATKHLLCYQRFVQSIPGL
jgi:hypothetical protein